MICPFMSDKNDLKACIGSCPLKVANTCAITQIAIELNNISKKLSNTKENSK